ncbi:MAG: hypothetical protein JWO48_2068 [Bryobacterales bacterium]|nr:hypothetical protein [Bryobacterales bacterium]
MRCRARPDLRMYCHQYAVSTISLPGYHMHCKNLRNVGGVCNRV